MYFKKYLNDKRLRGEITSLVGTYAGELAKYATATRVTVYVRISLKMGHGGKIKYTKKNSGKTCFISNLRILIGPRRDDHALRTLQNVACNFVTRGLLYPFLRFIFCTVLR